MDTWQRYKFLFAKVTRVKSFSVERELSLRPKLTGTLWQSLPETLRIWRACPTVASCAHPRAEAGNRNSIHFVLRWRTTSSSRL